MTAVHAANKVSVKYGPVKFKATSGAVAASVGSKTQISLGGGSRKGSGTFNIFLEASEVAQLAKGVTFDVVGDGEDFDGDNAVLILFQGTKTKGSGFNTITYGYTSSHETTAEGTFKVISYDEATRTLKFILVAKASPYVLSKAKIGSSQSNTTVTKALPIKIAGTVILP